MSDIYLNFSSKTENCFFFALYELKSAKFKEWASISELFKIVEWGRLWTKIQLYLNLGEGGVEWSKPLKIFFFKPIVQNLKLYYIFEAGS